ncbi:MAG: NAD(P)-binding protein, partial [Proteobacteria bacterium]|nr:NAD(P)-binding protein [Pseudomonadota bacterium]
MDTKPVSGESRSSTVLVLGGGLSGLSAACHLLDNGYRVSLIEKRPFLGGRAFSFKDEGSGV